MGSCKGKDLRQILINAGHIISIVGCQLDRSEIPWPWVCVEVLYNIYSGF